MSAELIGVTVRYDTTVALDDISFVAPNGVVSAVVGGDGAGKTTLLNCFTGMVRPVSGRVDGPAKHQIGFMPSTSGTWRSLSVDENFDFVAKAYGISGGELDRKRSALLAKAGLDHARGRLAGQLSGGMRQKLGFMLALLHEPALLILDEPTTGVDPVSRIELWRLISEAAAAGTAVVMATTYLDEAERASTVLVLDAGIALAHGTAAEIVGSLPGTITVTEHPQDPQRAWRRGRIYHEWHPGGLPAAEQAARVIDLEDVVIAKMLQRREQGTGSPR